MDLLYRVLIELPIEGIRQLSPSDEIDIQVGLARERLLRVYRMSSETLNSLLGLFGEENLYEYYHIYTLLGELST